MIVTSSTTMNCVTLATARTAPPDRERRRLRNPLRKTVDVTLTARHPSRSKLLKPWVLLWPATRDGERRSGLGQFASQGIL
jgi:hypothetical protein